MSLVELPHELLQRVCSFSNDKEVAQLDATCRVLRHNVTPKVWEQRNQKSLQKRWLQQAPKNYSAPELVNPNLQLSFRRWEYRYNKTESKRLLRNLQTHQHGWVFNCPVDPVELGLPDYFEIVRNPMDLGTIRRKIDRLHRRHPHPRNGYSLATFFVDFVADVRLVFDNAMLYNTDESVVHEMARDLRALFERDLTNTELNRISMQEKVKEWDQRRWDENDAAHTESSQ